MKIQFKHSRLRREWAVLLLKNPELAYIVLHTARLMGGNITLTDIFRPEARQRAIYPDDPKKQSVHQYWRGVDIRSRGYAVTKLLRIQSEVNYKFPYGRGNIQTVVYHKVGGGGFHLHIQNRG